MSTFREAVEEIQSTCPAMDRHEFVPDKCPYYPADREKCERCDVDRILAAYKGVVEGIPLKEQALKSKVFISEYQKGFHWGAIAQLEACKSYLMDGEK
jgi:hypothetical protein